MMHVPKPPIPPILIVIALLVFAAYQANRLAMLLVGGSSTLILPLGTALQAAAAVLAALGILGRRGWVVACLLVLAASAFVTSLYSAFVLGIIPWFNVLTYSLAVLLAVFTCIWWFLRQNQIRTD
jgi:hypothetical protein